jgi:chromosome segregation ATPase
LAVEMMAEGSETPNGEQGMGPEGRPRRGEGDLFAERRARRAAESGEVALMRRAEAAEATVQTLERHVASLQQRLLEVEEERQRMEELLDAERDGVLEREHELRRVKQREYAEQQLRVEAEDRLLSTDRESLAEIERLSQRLDASEQEARGLMLRLEGLQRQLAEAEHETGAERASVRRTEQDLQVRLSDLERRALEIQSGLEAERAAREQSERQLQSMREGHRQMEGLLGEMKGIVARVSSALETEERARIARAGVPAAAPEVRGTDMADALAAAVDRLRARAEAVPAEIEGAHEAHEDAPAQASGPAPKGAQPQAAARVSQTSVSASRPSPPAAQPPASAARSVFREPVVLPPPHKHSLSWFARRRIRRKQRRMP